MFQGITTHTHTHTHKIVKVRPIEALARACTLLTLLTIRDKNIDTQLTVPTITSRLCVEAMIKEFYWHVPQVYVRLV